MRTPHVIHTLRHTLLNTCALALLATPLAATAFDPNQGIEPSALPKVTHITAPQAQAAPAAAIDFPEVTAPVVAALPTPAPAPAPELASNTTQEPDFIAPAPLLADGQAQPALPAPSPELGALPAPTLHAENQPTEQPPAMEAPHTPEKLSSASKHVLGAVPSKLDSPKDTKISKLKVARTSPEVKDLAKTAKPKTESFDSIGLSIRVQGKEVDTNAELNYAYNALISGDTANAIAAYKTVLSAEPENQDALFGLASIYHRAGDIDRARPYYGDLLKINPNHREGISNFMALISDEAPHEALAELERLEQRNPDFSPIPAQQAILLRKLGFKEQARDKMLRSIELAPENLTYQYNLAVFLDQEGDYKDAANIYRILIAASLNGEKIPASLESLQKRLNYITTAAVSTATVGS